VSGLVAIAYPDLATAEQVRDELRAAAEDGLLQLDDAVLVERTEDGDVVLHQFRSKTGRTAAGGAAAGAVIGMLFLAPLLGAAIGAAGGAIGGQLADEGIDDTFMEDLGANLRPGAAALIALGSTTDREQVIERVKGYGGVVLQSSLSPADHERLRAALGS
jgi:uncharacterized membrane protein